MGGLAGVMGSVWDTLVVMEEIGRIGTITDHIENVLGRVPI